MTNRRPLHKRQPLCPRLGPGGASALATLFALVAFLGGPLALWLAVLRG